MGTSFIFMLMTILCGGGPGNDLLGRIPSDVYWKSKDVELNAGNILLELNSIKADDTSKATAVRKLMAIRALGELKSADAVSTLQVQLDSKEMFVAEYAQRAIDAIDGKPAASVSGVPPERMKGDLYMLPEHCGAVAQIRMHPGPILDFNKLYATSQPADPNGAPSPLYTLMAPMLTGYINVAEMTGNIRLDGLTIGVSEQIGPQAGFVAVYARGQWDADAVKAAIRTHFSEIKTAGEVEFMSPQLSVPAAAVAVPSDELFAFVVGPLPGNMPLDEIGTAIKSGNGNIKNSADLIKVLDSIDTTQPVWAAMLVGDNYKQAPALAPFSSLKLVGKATADGIAFEASGVGKDADAIKSATDQITSMLTEGRDELSRDADQMPALQLMADFLDGLQIKAEGTMVTATGTMKRPG